MALEGPLISLDTRIAYREEAILLDLADKNWGTVKITKQGWKIETPAWPLFRRYSQQSELAEPVHGGGADAAWKLMEHVNLKSVDHLLFMTYAGTLFMPFIPHVILVLYGPQGSTKTTTMAILKDFLDPSPLGVATIARDERELVQQLDHTYLAFFDNVGSLPDWQSDALCRATTGAGFSKRALYTDDDDVISWIRTPVGLNAINIAAQKPDLLDRSLLFKQEKPATRKQEKAVLAEFRREQPAILGGFLDVVVKALNLP